MPRLSCPPRLALGTIGRVVMVKNYVVHANINGWYRTALCGAERGDFDGTRHMMRYSLYVKRLNVAYIKLLRT